MCTVTSLLFFFLGGDQVCLLVVHGISSFSFSLRLSLDSSFDGVVFEETLRICTGFSFSRLHMGWMSQERFGARFVELTSPLRLHIRASQWAGSPRLSDTEPFRPENAFWPRPNDLRQARVGTHRPRDGSSSRLATHGASRAGAEHLSRLWRESGSSASAPAGGGIPDGRPAYRRRSFDSILAPPPRRRASSDAVSSWERGLLVE